MATNTAATPSPVPTDPTPPLPRLLDVLRGLTGPLGWFMLGVALLVAFGLLPLALVSGMADDARSAREILERETLVAEVHTKILNEDIALREHIDAPTPARAEAFRTGADQVAAALREAGTSSDARLRQHAARLTDKQAAYLGTTVPFLDGGASASGTSAERLAATAAYQALTGDAGQIRADYARAASAAIGQVDQGRSAARVSIVGLIILGVAGAALAGSVSVALLYREARAKAQAEAHPRHIDPLTGLLDHTGFTAQLSTELGQARHNAGRGLTVLFVGLNGYQAVRSMYGLGGCQQLVVAAGKRLRRAVRDVDTVAYLGDDRFGVILHDMVNRMDVQAVTGRVEETLNRSFRLQEGLATVVTAIGVCLGPPDSDPAQLTALADEALTAITGSGGGILFAQPNT